MTTSSTDTFAADSLETSTVATEHATYAYRRFGPRSGPPLVMVTRFRGTMDHWDPALLDRLAAQHDVIVFDNVGLGASTGTPADSVPGMVEGAVAFIRALELEEVDVLGWSMGGYVALGVALEHPELVRRLVVAGSSPGGVPDLPKPPARVFTEVAVRPVNTDEDYLYLFFPETATARARGIESLRRIDTRLSRSGSVVSPTAVASQLRAIAQFEGYWDRLDEVALPVLVANGAHDVMIHAYGSYAASQRLPDAKVVLYTDAGHGFLFQHIDDFAREVTAFLS